MDKIESDHYGSVVWLVFCWLEVAGDLDICDIFLLICGYIVIWEEENGICSCYTVAYSLCQASVLIVKRV